MRKLSSLFLMLVIISTALLPIITAKIANEKSFQGNDGKISLVKRDKKGPVLDRFINFLKKIPFLNRTLNFIKNFFGLVENTPELDDSDSYYQPYYHAKNGPNEESPTDTSISVTIKDFDVIYEREGEHFDFEIGFDGKTNGDVYACYYVMVAYFTDGTSTYYGTWNGPTDQPEIQYDDLTVGLKFYGTGSGGKSDWSTFKGRQYSNGIITDEDETQIVVPKDTSGKQAKDYILHVRAFSDKELTKWNQDSKSLFDDLSGILYEPKSEKDEKDEKDSVIPGFETMFLLLAIGVVLMFLRKKKLN